MRIVCLSDTHGMHAQLKVPDGDILLHAGDFTNIGSMVEFIDFNNWLRSLPHKHKVFIAGNHDFLFERNKAEDIEARVGGFGGIYLQDAEVTVNGIRIYGSPWTPQFYSWAFMLDRYGEIKEKWDKIPAGLDILMTHGPPLSILDKNNASMECGCYDLGQRVLEVKPTLHVFGHIHESYGTKKLNGTTYINASLHRWQRPKDPIVFEL